MIGLRHDLVQNYEEDEDIGDDDACGHDGQLAAQVTAIFATLADLEALRQRTGHGSPLIRLSQFSLWCGAMAQLEQAMPRLAKLHVRWVVLGRGMRFNVCWVCFVF